MIVFDMTKDEPKLGSKIVEILYIAREIEYLTRPADNTEHETME
jgi:hypothetical protein